MASLAALQRRFYELVTAGGGTVEAGFVGDPSRLGVYAEMYAARLHDVLADDYPKLRAALGDEGFHEVVEGYLCAVPPSSFTLREVGAALPDYLTGRSSIPPWAADLAKLERARVDVFDGRDATPLARDDLAKVPVEEFPAFAIAWVPASAIVRLAWSIDDLWAAVEAGAPAVDPEPAARSLLVWRRDLRVFHRALDDDEAELAVLVAANATIAELSATVSAGGGGAPDHRIVELLTRWLDAGAVVRSSVL